MGAREETQKPQSSNGVSLTSYSLRLSWQWGAEVWRATPPPGIRHRCLSDNHCVYLLCPLLPLPVPTSPPTPWLLLRLSLEVMTILCRCENIETSEGVPLFVTGVAQVITHLLPPLYLTFSFPALWGLASRSRMDSPPKSVCASLLSAPTSAALGARMDPYRSPAPLPSPTGTASGERTRDPRSSAKVCQWGSLDARPKLGVS